MKKKVSCVITENKIKEIYKRRQKAHEELLACDIELDKILRKMELPPYLKNKSGGLPI